MRRVVVLPARVWAEKREELALRDGEVEAVYRGADEAFVEIAQAEGRDGAPGA